MAVPHTENKTAQQTPHYAHHEEGDREMSTTRRAPEYARPEVSVGRFNSAPVVTLTAGRRSICIRPEDARDIVTGIADVIAWLETTEGR